MTPPVIPFSPASLPFEATLFENSGKYKIRKGFDGNLKNCELLKLKQYNCNLQKDGPVEDSRKRIICESVERLFRRCKDRQGTFMVETTAWEREKSEE